MQVRISGEVPEGTLRRVQADHAWVAVANVAGQLYGFDDTCTHQGCSLSEGRLTGTTVTCRCHGSEFDVTTGEVLEGPAEDALETWEVVRD